MKKAHINLRKSYCKQATFTQTQKNTPSIHQRIGNSSERNGMHLNFEKKIQNNYKFPRKESISSDNISLRQIDQDSCDDMRGIYIYQLGKENPTTCKLAQVPIKMKPKPILSVKQIKQISLQKKPINCSISQIKYPLSYQQQKDQRKSFPIQNKCYHKLSGKKVLNFNERFIIESPIKEFQKKDSRVRLQNSTEQNTRIPCSINNSVLHNKISNSQNKIHLSLSKRTIGLPRQYNASHEQSGRISLSRPKSKSAKKKKIEIITNGDGYRRIDSLQFPNDTDRDYENQYSERNPRFDRNFQSIPSITRIKIQPNKQRGDKSRKKITISIRKNF